MKKTIGRYEVKERLGQGGMADVYLAYDPRFKRDVAIKVLPGELMRDDTYRARFEREAQTIAHLEHTAIVPVYDFGEEDGRTYLVMRYMQGGSLRDYLKAKGPLLIEEVAEIIARIAPALQKAHAQGIIHRDLKPGNILFDADNNPYLSDFGIAKLSESTVNLTGDRIIGTPAYMSPEQARGQSDLDGRSDVYALAVIVYEMLTGKQPYEADTPMGLAMAHLMNPVPNILESKPDLPRGTDTIISRGLAKEPVQRYGTPDELCEALTAVSTGKYEALEKEQDSTIAMEELDVATTHREEHTEIIGEELTAPDDRPMDQVPVAPLREPISPPLPIAASRRKSKMPSWLIWGGIIVLTFGMLFCCAIFGFQFLSTIANISGTQTPTLVSTEVGVTPAPSWTPTRAALIQGTPTAVNTSITNFEELTVLSGHSGLVLGVDWSPDGSLLASGSEDTSARIWDVWRGVTLDVFDAHTEHVRSVGWSPDGQNVATVSYDDSTLIWSVDASQWVAWLGVHENYVLDVAWSPDGQFLATAGGDDTTLIWGRNDQQQWYVLHALDIFSGYVRSVAWSPDGSMLAVGSESDFLVRVFDTGNWAQLASLEGHIEDVYSVSWAPDGRYLASGGEDDNVIIWDVPGQETVQVLEGHLGDVWDVAWSPDGQYVASGGGDSTVRVWEAETWGTAAIFESDMGIVFSVDWSPDSRYLAVGSGDAKIHIWGEHPPDIWGE
jgi:serine/threonine protein kinase